jgi:hypothetical protein
MNYQLGYRRAVLTCQRLNKVRLYSGHYLTIWRFTEAVGQMVDGQNEVMFDRREENTFYSICFFCGVGIVFDSNGIP